MTTIFERVKNALNTLAPAVPFGLAPYKVSGDLPDTYLAYQLIDSTPEQHADDQETQRSDVIQISIYARGGLAVLPDVKTAMLSAGFQKSHERQLPQDIQTLHYGLAQDYVYFE